MVFFGSGKLLQQILSVLLGMRLGYLGVFRCVFILISTVKHTTRSSAETQSVRRPAPTVTSFGEQNSRVHTDTDHAYTHTYTHTCKHTDRYTGRHTHMLTQATHSHIRTHTTQTDRHTHACKHTDHTDLPVSGPSFASLILSSLETFFVTPAKQEAVQRHCGCHVPPNHLQNKRDALRNFVLKTHQADFGLLVQVSCTMEKENSVQEPRNRFHLF